MFRKPSIVNGAPKLEPKYENKYQLKEEPKFDIKPKIEPKLEPKVEPTDNLSTKRSLIAKQSTVARWKRENQEDKEVNLYIRVLTPGLMMWSYINYS